MAITPVEIGRLTLDDLEVIAERFSTALDTIREAQAMLGANVGLPTVAPAQPPVAVKPAVQQISPEAQAELDAWRAGPARAKLLEQFQPTQEPQWPPTQE